MTQIEMWKLKAPLQDYNDAYYSSKTTFETKHFHMAFQYLDFFKPKSVADYGCATGLFLAAMKVIEPSLEVQGYDFSPYAVKYAVNQVPITTDFNQFGRRQYELLLSMDLLEHIPIEQVDSVLEQHRNLTSKWILFSICMFHDDGIDPNYYLDSTHILLRTKNWWKNKIREHGFKIIDVPKSFWFEKQLLIGEKI